MRSIARLLPLIVALLGAPVASAQTQAPPPPAGSLTVHSRPAGATIRFARPHALVGRTPVTVARGPWGRVRLSGSAPGYETRRRTVQLAPGAADTMWVTLTPKHALKAGMRSLVLPGWGQLYNERPGHAWVFGIAGAGGATALAVTHIQYGDKADLLASLDLAYARNPTPSNLMLRDAAAAEVTRARDAREMATMVAAGVWGLNVLDALVFGPPRRAPAIAFRVTPAGGSGVRAFAQVRFR